MYRKTSEGWNWEENGTIQYTTPYVALCFVKNEEDATTEIFRHGSVSLVESFFLKHKDGMAPIGEKLEFLTSVHITESDLNFLIEQGTVSTEKFNSVTSPIVNI
jgi:hypothetical protein